MCLPFCPLVGGQNSQTKPSGPELFAGNLLAQRPRRFCRRILPPHEGAEKKHDWPRLSQPPKFVLFWRERPMQQQVHRLQQNLVLLAHAPVAASASPINRLRTSPLLLSTLQPHTTRATVGVGGGTISPEHQPTTRGENFSLVTSAVAHVQTFSAPQQCIRIGRWRCSNTRQNEAVPFLPKAPANN